MWQKYIILSVCVILFGINECCAETVTRKEAFKVAQAFFSVANNSAVSEPKLIYNGRRLTTDKLFTPFYVYNHPDGGYVIVSADNKAFPVLAYDVNENFDPGNIDSLTATFLKQYAREIELIRYDSRIPFDAIEAWSDIQKYILGILKNSNDNNGKYYIQSSVEFSNLETVSSSVAEDVTIDQDDVPFAIHDMFMKEVKAAIDGEKTISEGIQDPAPVVKSLGGGHFEITLPEEVYMARIYNLQGAQVDNNIFHNTNVATIRLDSQSQGFYFLLLNTKSGKKYGIKLFK